VRAQPRVLVKQDFFWSATNQGCIWPGVCTCVRTSSVMHWHVYLLIHELVWPRARTCEHWNTLQAPTVQRPSVAQELCVHSRLQGCGRSAICWNLCQQRLLTEERDLSYTSSDNTCTCSLLVQRVRQMAKGAQLSASELERSAINSKPYLDLSYVRTNRQLQLLQLSMCSSLTSKNMPLNAM
jgi:hypothetical protein